MMTAQLQWEGVEVNRKAIQRHMREMGIEGIHPGPNVSLPHAKGRHLSLSFASYDQEVTQSSLGTGYHVHPPGVGSWMDLVAVLDCYSRSVLSWELDQSREVPCVLSSLERALAQATPTICQRDQGSHFTSPQYRNMLQAAEVQISMDGKGRALDNMFTERLWRTSNYEEVSLHEYASPKEARQQLPDYLQLYNHQRLHQALDDRPPACVSFAPQSQENDGMGAGNRRKLPEAR
jgi:putative transposase